MKLKEIVPKLDLNYPNRVYHDVHYFGRKAQVALLVDTLLHGLDSHRRSLIVTGERKMGVTSFISTTVRVAERRNNRLVPVWLPHLGLVKTADDLAYIILEALAYAAGKKLVGFQALDLFAGDRTLSLEQFTAHAKQLSASSPGKLFVVVAEELDAVLWDAKEEAARILAFTADMLALHELPIVMIITMLAPALERISAETEVLGGTQLGFEHINLGPLTVEETTEMVVGMLTPYVSFDDRGLERLYQLSGGHPFITKLLISVLLQRHADQELPLTVRAATFDEEFLRTAAIDHRMRNVFENIYHVHFSQEAKGLLFLISERTGGISPETLAVLHNDYLSQAQGLISRGYLMWTNEGKLDFRSEYLRHWLKHWPRYALEQASFVMSTVR